MWNNIIGTKNCSVPVRKLLRNISVTQVPWADVMHGLLKRLYTENGKAPELIGAALRTSCYYTYLHDVSHRKEIQLEMLVLGLHELLRRKQLSTSRDDWI